MSVDVIDTQYYVYLIAWLVVPIGLFAAYSRRGQLAGVLVFAYFAGFFISHWMGALVHASPRSLLLGTDDTVAGFHLSTLGLFAFACGVLLAGARRVSNARGPRDTSSKLPPLLARTLLTIGVATWILSFTPVATLPSASAVLSAGRQCALLALCLLCWSAWQQRRIASFWWWLAAASMLPLVTAITQGLIGYGIMMLTMVLVFIAMFFRPRWILLLGLIVGVYGGMTFWISYLAHRDDLRAAVWGGADYKTRWSSFSDIFNSIEPFNFANPDHLERIDVRLNQNVLVGAAVRTTPDLVPYENGATIYDAMLAIIPRAIWPDKPMMAGSGDYVSKHTMIEFAEGISVGMGQVIEFYINFGVPGVLIGFVAFGLVLRRLDLRLTDALRDRDFHKLTFYFLVGTSALQPGGSLVEVVAAMGGGAVLSIAISRFIRRRIGTRGLPGFEHEYDALRLNSQPGDRPTSPRFEPTVPSMRRPGRHRVVRVSDG